MNTSKAIVELYRIIEKMDNPIEAKNSVRAMIFNVISELQDEKLPITEELLDERMSKYAHDFIDVENAIAKKDIA